MRYSDRERERERAKSMGRIIYSMTWLTLDFNRMMIFLFAVYDGEDGRSGGNEARRRLRGYGESEFVCIFASRSGAFSSTTFQRAVLYRAGRREKEMIRTFCARVLLLNFKYLPPSSPLLPRLCGSCQFGRRLWKSAKRFSERRWCVCARARSSVL